MYTYRIRNRNFNLACTVHCMLTATFYLISAGGGVVPGSPPMYEALVMMLDKPLSSMRLAIASYLPPWLADAYI